MIFVVIEALGWVSLIIHSLFFILRIIFKELNWRIIFALIASIVMIGVGTWGGNKLNSADTIPVKVYTEEWELLSGNSDENIIYGEINSNDIINIYIPSGTKHLITYKNDVCIPQVIKTTWEKRFNNMNKILYFLSLAKLWEHTNRYETYEIILPESYNIVHFATYS